MVRSLIRATTSSRLVSLRHSSTLKRRFSIQLPCLSGDDMRTEEEQLLRGVKRGKENEELFRLAERKGTANHVLWHVLGDLVV